ncbi:M4 family metallopeptidase [Streptomyces sp. NPDC046909]|uniref:M4 family metallopeptidase n=1 Tax=Streptomyces sp. NPDC046909 TaxID=3155617 RepID=UPI003411C320
MDITLISTLLGVAGGALATGAGAVLRTRHSVRTAARLIYAELRREATAVTYFRKYGHWAAATPSRDAWDTNSAVLARRRASATFEAVVEGYEALESMPFMVGDALPPGRREPFMRDVVKALVVALTDIGRVAGIPAAQLKAVTEPLKNAQPLARTGAPTAAGTIPSFLRRRMATDDGYVPLALPFSGVRLWAGRVVISDGSATVEQTKYVVFDAQGSDELEGHPVARLAGGAATGDAAVDEAYDGLVATATFLAEVFGRNHLHEPGTPFAAVVHYGTNYNNAFVRDEVMYLGDGDDRYFTRFTHIDVIAVELCKGLPELWSMAGHGQNGALRGSIRDVLGVLVKQYAHQCTVEDADWLLGAGLLAPGIDGVALRSIKAPGTAYDDPDLGKDPQPSKMADYVHTDDDNGGIHINSGIPSRAFYLLAEQLGGRAWERAGQIWWDVLTSGQLDSTTQFADFARLTTAAALERYGDGEEHRAVRAAWNGVGLSST